MNGTINELKQGLLKCAKENKEKTYFTGQVVISSICKDAKNTIEELEKENKQFKQQVENTRNKLFNILTEYEIGNYDSKFHNFYEDVYDVHNELMELAEWKMKKNT